MSGSIADFFLHYEENNGFPYNPSRDPLKEFKKLREYMNWGHKAAARHKDELIELINSANNDENDDGEEDEDFYGYEGEEEGYSEYYSEDDDFDINNFNDVHEYFEYFKNSENFQYDPYENAKINFEKLARFMKWSKKSAYERNKFNRLQSNNEKKKYLIEHQRDGWFYRESLSLEDNFEDLCEYRGWNEYEKNERDFDELVDFQVENIPEDVETLRETIIFYGIHHRLNHMPTTLTQCKKVMKKYLFVNIYDYVAGNKKKFDDLKSLRRYSFKNNLIYKKEIAKEHLVKKILLRNLF